jgi:hypothetical protein
MAERAAQRAKVVTPYMYGGELEEELWSVFVGCCAKGLMDQAAYAGPTLASINAAGTPPLTVPSVSDGQIELTRIPNTSPPELTRNFRYGLTDVTVTASIKKGIEYVNSTFLGSGGFPMFLRGPGGLGKTTGLVAIAQLFQEKGYMSVFIQLKGLATGAPSSYVVAWAKNCLQDCLFTFKDDKSNPWKHIGVSERHLPGVSCFDLLSFLSEGDVNDAECLFAINRLFSRLSVEKYFPVGIFLDQWNAMEKEYWTDGRHYYTKGSHPVGKVFANWEQNRAPAIFQSAGGSDGNGSIHLHTMKVWPMHKCRWLFDKIRATTDASPLTDKEMNSIAALCGSLPREMIRYWVEAKGDKNVYLEKAITDFRIRVKSLIHRDSEDSLKFAAYVYMHHANWANMPPAWTVAGVMHEVTPRRWDWVCEAAMTGFLKAFRQMEDPFTGVPGSYRPTIKRSNWL